MIRLIGTVSMLLLGIVHAQENTILSIQQDYQNKLAQLEQLGHDQIGYYPYCSDVVNLYLEEKEAILKAVQQNYLLPEEQQLLNIKVDLDRSQERQRHAALSQEDVDWVSSGQKGYNRSYNNCFTGNTPVTVFFTLTTKISWNQYDHKIVATTMELQEMYEQQEDKGFHVLSSSLGKIEKAPSRYKKDCWARVNQVHLGHVRDGKTMNMINVGPYGSDYTFKVTPQHRFYAYVQDECSEESMYQWQEAQNLEPGTAQLYQGEDGQLCPINATSEYAAESEGWGNFMPLKVYNLNTETHAYYVGPRGNQVLVHDTKLISE
ncbi:MAG TPA: hypothetical protein PKC21_06880 [Oligoflexia bacterium]|nr:hypothetical protein [Oligoflexia bacterium]HMR25061.1 hypothetical protein [Oligoflexia bacterium]